MAQRLTPTILILCYHCECSDFYSIEVVNVVGVLNVDGKSRSTAIVDKVRPMQGTAALDTHLTQSLCCHCL